MEFTQRQILSDKIADHRTDLENVSSGFLSNELIPQRLEQIRKGVTLLSEQGMKLLTTVDALRLGEEDGAESPEEFPESVKNAFKTKRKSLVTEINSVMDAADCLSEKIETLKSRQ